MTSDEVERASRISPLAMSLVKPPDPEILQALSFHDQREFTANWAKDSLSQMSSGSRSSSQQGSRRGSSGVTDDVESCEEKGFKGELRNFLLCVEVFLRVQENLSCAISVMSEHSS